MDLFFISHNFDYNSDIYNNFRTENVLHSAYSIYEYLCIFHQTHILEFHSRFVLYTVSVFHFEKHDCMWSKRDKVACHENCLLKNSIFISILTLTFLIYYIYSYTSQSNSNVKPGFCLIQDFILFFIFRSRRFSTFLTFLFCHQDILGSSYQIYEYCFLSFPPIFIIAWTHWDYCFVEFYMYFFLVLLFFILETVNKIVM